MSSAQQARPASAGSSRGQMSPKPTLQFNRPKTHKPELAPPVAFSQAREQHNAFLRKSLGFDSDSDDSDDDIAIEGVDNEEEIKTVPLEQLKAVEEQLLSEKQQKDDAVRAKHVAEEDVRKNRELLKRLEQRVKMQMSMLRSGYENQLKQRDLSLDDHQLCLKELMAYYRSASEKLKAFDASYEIADVVVPSLPVTPSADLSAANESVKLDAQVIRDCDDPSKLKDMVLELLSSGATLSDALVKLEPDITTSNPQVNLEVIGVLQEDLAQVKQELNATRQELETAKTASNGAPVNLDDKVKAVLIKLKTDNKDLKKKLKALKKAYLALEARGGGGGGGGAPPQSVAPPPSANMSQSDFDELIAAFKETKKKNKDLTKACKMLQSQVQSGGGGGGGGGANGNGTPVLNGGSDEYKAKFKEAKAKIAQLEAKLESSSQQNGSKAAEAASLSNAEIEKLTEKYKKMKETAQQFKDSCKKSEKELEKLQAGAAAKDVELESKVNKVKELQKQLQAFEGMSKMLPTMKRLYAEFSVVKRNFVSVQKDFRAHQQSIAPAFQSAKSAFDEQLAAHDAQLAHAVDRYRKESKLRRKLYNDLQDLRGNIRVYVRVRPPSKSELENPGFKKAVVFNDDTELTLINTASSTQKAFQFDRVFDIYSTQEMVFEDTEPLVTSVVDGYNVCIFAYGQTGTGKTYTMEGPPDNRGVNFRSLTELFRVLSNRSDDYEFSIEVSMLEIYNETIRDLLADPNQPRKKLEIKQSPQGVFVPDLVSSEVKSEEDIHALMSLGGKNRAVGTTNMNEHSSRSHAMLQIKVRSTNKHVGTKTMGKLTLCDLAGSERVSKSKASGDRLTETQNINKSLSALGDVINSLAVKNAHTPYRNSKLTYLLQDSLGGNSKTLMFVQISPAEENAPESMCSLNFAQRAKAVELGKAKKQGDDVEGAYYRKVADMLKGHLQAQGLPLPDLPPQPKAIRA